MIILRHRFREAPFFNYLPCILKRKIDIFKLLCGLRAVMKSSVFVMDQIAPAHYAGTGPKIPVHFYGYCILTGLACQSTGQLVTYTDIKYLTRSLFGMLSNITSHNCSRCQNRDKVFHLWIMNFFHSGSSFKCGNVPVGDISCKTEEALRRFEPSQSRYVACMTQFSRKLIADSVFLYGTQPYTI